MAARAFTCAPGSAANADEKAMAWIGPSDSPSAAANIVQILFLIEIVF